MLRSMYSAISGMDSFQTALDVVGNNIANVNTIGFKSSNADFADTLSQMISSGSQGVPSGGLGGTNPQQVGLGTKIAAIQTNFSQGADQATGNPTDVSINGAGFFVVTNGTNQFLTRAGDFSLDVNNNLVLPNGAVAEGYASPSGTISTSASLVPINLNDLLGQYLSNPTPAASPTATSYTVSGATYTLAANPNVQIGPNGAITAAVQVTTSTGTTTQTDTLGYMALGTVANQNGLEKVGDSMYQTSSSSGNPTYQQASMNNTGSLQSGYLEMSNVDLTQEFANMITDQEGFSANSKMITTDQTILQTMIGMVQG